MKNYTNAKMKTYYLSPEAAQRKRMRPIITLFAVIAILTTIISVQAMKIADLSRPHVIRHSIDGGYHNIIFTYRDTVALDMVSEAAYRKIVDDGILPKNSD